MLKQMEQTKIKKAVTLLEILLVIIVVGVLSTLGIASYIPAGEKVKDKEAWSNLKVIQAAEKAYHIDTEGVYYYPNSGSETNIDTINEKFKISLIAGLQKNWNFTVWDTGCAQATRNGGDGRSWHLAIDDADGEPDSGGCP